MPTTVNVKFAGIPFDTIPAELPSVILADLKNIIMDIYDNHGGEDTLKPGKVFFGNNTEDIAAPVLMVQLVAVKYDEVEGDIVVVWLANLSDSFQIPT